MTADLFIHVANVVFLASYSVRDVLWLRVLSLLGGALLMVYYFANGLWAPIAWNTIFSTVHIYHIGRLYLERRPVFLSSDELRLHTLAFPGFSPRDVRKLLAVGHWQEAAPDECLVQQGEALDRILVLFDGGARVEVGEKAVANLRPGAFVGEMSYLTDVAPNACVYAQEPSRYVLWRKDELERFLDAHPTVRAAFQQVLGADLARKLRAV